MYSSCSWLSDSDSWCGLSGGSSLHSVSWPLGYWIIGLVETPALPPCSSSSLSPGMWSPSTLFLPTSLALSSPSGSGGWDGWRGRAQPSRRADLWHLLSIQAEQRPPGAPSAERWGQPPSQTWRPWAPSLPWCQIPNGHSRMVAIRHIGSLGSALKSGNTESRNNETRSLPPSPLPTDIDLHCNNLLYHLCYGYYQGGWGETPPCFCLTVGAITINIATSRATESNLFCAVLTA